MDPTPIANNIWVQYGALGVLVLVSLLAVAALWKRNNALSDSVTTALINNTDALRALREGLRHD